MKRVRSLWILGVVFLSLAAGVSGGVALDRLVLDRFAPVGGIPADARPSFSLMAEAWDVIQRVYVDRSALEPRRLTYGAISGMTDSLGDTGHSHFLTPEMLKQEHNFTQGQFEGIGAEVRMKDGYVVIVAPMDGSPAQKAGLQPGDTILKVDGENIVGLPLGQVVERIMGPAGTRVQLTVMDPASGDTRDIPIIRAHITVQNVTWRILPGTTVAHVRVAVFSKGVTDDLQKALSEISSQEVTGIILDLRSNPGGLLDEAVGTASQFLSGGNVLLVQNAEGTVKAIPVEPDGTTPNTPVVVLINGGTASASEIVSGALQDAERAPLVGETTFGTGTVLNEFRLSDGSALLLATEEWLTPSGRVIWHQGITPDTVISLPTGTMPLFPVAEQDVTPDQLKATEDNQLLQALDILNSGGQ